MNLLRYLVLTIAILLVVLIDNSDADFNNTDNYLKNTIEYIKENSKKNEDDGIYVAATRVLRNYYINSTMIIAESEEIVYNGIESAKELNKEDPEAAKNEIKKSCAIALGLIFDSGLGFFLSQGGALGLSEPGAQKGLQHASILVQNAGLTIIDMVDVVNRLLTNAKGVESEEGEVLIQSVYLALKSAYVGIYSNIQKSFQKASDALRYPFKGTYKEENCTSTLNDKEGEQAVREIDEAADNAIRRGGNAEMIEQFKMMFTCAVGDLVKYTAEGKQTIENIRSFKGIEPLAVKITFFKRYETVKKGVQLFAAKIYLLLGKVAFTENKVTSIEIRSAVMAVERAVVEVVVGIQSAGGIIAIGERYQGEPATLALDAAGKTGFFAKKSYLKDIVNACKLAFSVL